MGWPRCLTRLARHVRAVLLRGPRPALPSCSAWGEGAGRGRDVGGLACAAYCIRIESDHVRPAYHDHPQSPPSLSYRQRRNTSQKLRGKSTQGFRVSSGVLKGGHSTPCMACSERMGHSGQGTWQPPACVAYAPAGGRCEAVGADIPIGLDDQGDGIGPPSGILPASVRGLHEQHSGWGFRRCCRHAVLGMTVIAAEEPAWTCAAAWGSMRRRHPPRGPTEASHASRIDAPRGCNGLGRTLALGVAVRRRGAAARDSVAKVVTPVLSDIEVETACIARASKTHRPM